MPAFRPSVRPATPTSSVPSSGTRRTSHFPRSDSSSCVIATLPPTASVRLFGRDVPCNDFLVHGHPRRALSELPADRGQKQSKVWLPDFRAVYQQFGTEFDDGLFRDRLHAGLPGIGPCHS